MLKMSPSITPTLFIDIASKLAITFSQKMVSSSSSSEAVEAVLGIVAKGNAILAEISRLAEVLVLAPFVDICPQYIYCFIKLCLWRKTKIKIFAPQNVPTLFLEGRGEGSQLLFDFAYFKVLPHFNFRVVWTNSDFNFSVPRRPRQSRPGSKRTTHLQTWTLVWRRNIWTSSHGAGSFQTSSELVIAGSTNVSRAFSCTAFLLCSWWRILREEGWFVKNNRSTKWYHQCREFGVMVFRLFHKISESWKSGTSNSLLRLC